MTYLHNDKGQVRVCIALSESSAIPSPWFESEESPSSAIEVDQSPWLK